MAWAEKRSAGKWRGQYRDSAGKKVSVPGTFPTKTAARAAADKAEVEANSHRGRMRTGKSPTWGEWCERWWKARSVEPATLQNESSMIHKHIAPRWADVKLDEIRRLDVQAWVADLPLAPESARRVLGVLVSSLSAAVEEGVLDMNPAHRIKLPPRPQGREVFLTRDQFDSLTAAIPNARNRAIVKLLAGTGMRWGELAGLHWHNFDLSNGFVTVRDVYSAGEIKPYPKGRKQRHVPLFDWVVEDLDAAASRVVCAAPHRTGICQSGLVAHTSGGLPLDSRNFYRRVLAPALKEAQLDHLGLTIHDLRHTYASWLAQAGIPLERISALLGHSSITTTQIYAHLMPAKHDDIAAALGANWGQTSTISHSKPLFAVI